ncbi:precorrin-6A/cobalt-precorrin-6A reductase [Roseobacter sp. GAI101]|uniref:precorrin-6A/cobalt-precorrin-6A reductase n=1 Tax=Roseobacter sp. (strain GAI101) TaxID=391589 RepID=UPI000187209E|nr:precorrin-6A/cobalt-precorrin-6A reductase [Roseobacter sp. GAI101]EEB84069.1 precorrin-6A reductase, putative [Roseobacter sp. GAI101]
MENLSHILLIAGSAEAHEFAAQVAQTSQKLQAILRRAERSFGPLAVPSRIWTPGSLEAMKNFLTDEGITAICDAGHGFDSDVADLAAAAARDLALPYVRVMRPVWTIDPPALRAATVAEAAVMIRPGARVFAATGRGTVAEFAPFAGDTLFLRQTSAAARTPLPEFAEPVYGTPPFSIDEEIALFQRLGIDTLICRNVGGLPSRPKLEAAMRLGMRVIVIDRPAPPKKAHVLETADAAVGWITAL